MNATSQQSKSIFRSKTFWGAVLTFIAATTPNIAEEYTRFQETGKISPSGVSNIVVIVATTGLTILGRIDATETVYTPKGLPGQNKPQH